MTNKVSWPGAFTAFVAAILIFVTSQLLAAVAVGLLASGQGTELTLFGSQVLLQFTFGLIAYGGMLAAIYYFLRWRGLGWRDIGLTRPKLSDAGLAAVAFVCYVSAYVVLVSVVSPFIPGLDIGQRQDIGFDDAAGWQLALVFLVLVVLAPVAEEVMMRGFLFTSLRRRLPFWLTTLLVSILFAFLHLGGGEQGAGPLWIAAIDTFILSLALCYLRERTGRLWASIALHALKNGIAFTALFIFASAA